MTVKTITPGQHACCIGQTGSGKSVMLQELIRLAPVAPVFVMDSKIDDGFLTVARDDEELIIFDDGIIPFEKYITQPARKIADYVIIRPPLDEVTDPDILDNYLLLIHTRFKNKCVIVVDELYMLHKNGRAGPGLSGCLTRGRSKGHSVLGATQRPSWISRFCLSEMTYYYIFRLLEIDDRKRFSHVGYGKHNLLDRFHYYHYDSISGDGGNFPPIEIRQFEAKQNLIKGRWL